MFGLKQPGTGNAERGTGNAGPGTSDSKSKTNLYHQAIAFLKQPFPFETRPYSNPRVILSITVFLFLFLLIFQPFGLGYLGTGRLILRVGEYVAVIFLILCFNFLVLPKIFTNFFSDENWTILKNVLFALYNVSVIGSCTLLYVNFRGQVQLTLGNFIHFEIYTILIGGMPVALFMLFNHVHTLNKHLKTAGMLNQSLPYESRSMGDITKESGRVITLTSETGKDSRSFQTDSLLAFVSADNYTSIFVEQGGQIKNELLRSSLTRIESALRQYPEFFRCHRTYIINLHKIKKIKGNSQGYKLVLDKLDVEIPVARAHVKHFNERMRDLSGRARL